MFGFLLATADEERRSALTVLVAMRWVIIAAAALYVNYRPGSEALEYTVLNILICVAALMNVAFHYRLATGRNIILAYPVVSGLFDALGVTSAIAFVDGFDNPTYVLYYPALLSFVLVFPGRWSAMYTASLMAAYAFVAFFGKGSFSFDSAGDQKTLILRLLTIATAAMTANLIVRQERQRRQTAVAAEAERAREALAAEQRALDAERKIEGERLRLSQEVHDGVAQNIYMLTLGLETEAGLAERADNVTAATRLRALHRLSQETLLETRNLLFDLSQVMAGELSVVALVRNQAREFGTIAGVPVEVTSRGPDSGLDPAVVGGLFHMVREGLSNALRHAHASSVHIDLDFSETAVAVEIRDDGCGFVPGAHRRGNGLQNLRSRAQHLHGSFRVESTPGGGTVLRIEVPLATNGQAVPA